MRATVPFLLTLLLVAGCSTTRPGRAGDGDADAAAQAAQAWHGGAAALKTDLMVRIKPPGRNAMIFTITAWRDGDGRVRLEASKVGIAGFEGVVRPDGGFTVVARDGTVVEDDLEAVFAEELGPGASLARLIEELALGPVPAAADWRRGEDGTLVGTDPATGLRVVVTMAGRGHEVASKSFRDAAGGEAMRLDYARYREFEGLRRPGLITVAIPARPGECMVRLQTLDRLPGVSDARMHLEAPAGRERLPFAEFLHRLAE